MQVTNPGNRVFLACVGDYVDGGGSVEVPEADGVSLIEQGWSPAFKTGGAIPKSKPKRVIVKAGETVEPPATAEQED